MSDYPKTALLVLAGFLVCQTSCSNSLAVAPAYVPGQNGRMSNTQIETLTVRIDRSGRAHDENGEEITLKDVSERLTNGTLKQTTPVAILVRGGQKDGVLETAQMFTALGFTSVVIRLVHEEPLK